jgi:hypothetical protein
MPAIGAVARGADPHVQAADIAGGVGPAAVVRDL